MSKSVVTGASPVLDATGAHKVWAGQYGTFYLYTIAFADGVTGEYMNKEANQSVFVVGQEAEYEFTPNSNPQYAGRIKKPRPEGGWSGGGGSKSDPYMAETMMMAYAKDIAVARINQGMVKEVDVASIIRDYKAMLGEVKATPVATPVAPVQAEGAAAPVATGSDKLPF